MGLIKKLLSFVFIVVLLVVAALAGAYFYIRKTHGIDLIQTLRELKTLSQEVDEGALCPEAFSANDMVDVQTLVNESAENLITYIEGEGYSVNFDALPEQMRYVIKLTDKQVGALADVVIKQETGGVITVGGKQIPLALKQVDFSSVGDAGATLAVVVALDITPFKAEMKSGFPFDWLKGYIPDALYISSTVRVEKGVEAFSYAVSHESLCINALSFKDTEDLFHTLNVFFRFGEASELNLRVGEAVMSALVGTPTEQGLARSLSPIGATDFSFLLEEGKEYFAVLR